MVKNYCSHPKRLQSLNCSSGGSGGIAAKEISTLCLKQLQNLANNPNRTLPLSHNHKATQKTLQASQNVTEEAQLYEKRMALVFLCL